MFSALFLTLELKHCMEHFNNVYGNNFAVYCDRKLSDFMKNILICVHNLCDEDGSIYKIK